MKKEIQTKLSSEFQIKYLLKILHIRDIVLHIKYHLNEYETIYKGNFHNHITEEMHNSKISIRKRLTSI